MALEKPAETQYPIHDLIRRRWSPRAFAGRPVEPEKLGSLLEAARWGASCFNQQPWFFIVAKQDDGDSFNRLLNCLVEGNKAWAQRAPVLMLSVARLTFDEGGQPNRHALHDVGFAAGTLCLQATALGLVVHQMAGFDMGKAREAFRIPEGYEPVAAIALGYQDEPGILSDKLQAKERTLRTRKELSGFVFSGTWGNRAAFLKSE
jgi:nitroreductase